MELKRDDLNNLRKASNILLGFDEDDLSFEDIYPNEELKTSLDNYRSSGHYDINNVFRGLIKGNEITEKLQNDVKNLNDAMKLVKPYRINRGRFIVWRGIDLSKDEYHPDKRRYYNEIINLHKNGTSNNEAFLSTSYSKDVALTFTDCCLFKIHVDPKEDLEYILIDIMGERELLFQHTTYFKYIREYPERDDENDKDYTVYEVSLHKGSVIREYTYKEKVIKNDEELLGEIINRIPKKIDLETVKDLKETFEWELEEVQEDLWDDFKKSILNTYPDDIQNIRKYEEEIKEKVYSHVKDLY